MSQALSEVFTLDEVAYAAGVSRQLAAEHGEAGELRFIPGTRYMAGTDAIEAARRLRAAAGENTPSIAETPLFNVRPRGAAFGSRRLPAFASSFIHAALVALVLWATAAPAGTNAEPAADEEARLVFVMIPGPGGGGGGGGERSRTPARRLQRRGADRAELAVPKVTPEPILASRKTEEALPSRRALLPQPKPVEREPDPLPSSTLIAPVAAAATNTNEKRGVVENARGEEDSQGAGVGGGAGTGQGTGNGEGLGSGLGDGAGGGTGGGPYRPGSGIEAPRLLREVKADYTDEARRRGITGDVLLEIVVRRDGTVGNVSLLKGIGGGLDQRAVAAVRQWRFAPARKQGEPVDVIVEVAVEFSLR